MLNHLASFKIQVDCNCFNLHNGCLNDSFRADYHQIFNCLGHDPGFILCMLYIFLHAFGVVCWLFCSKINFSNTFFQEHYQSAK